jgi:hypothetical protein
MLLEFPLSHFDLRLYCNSLFLLNKFHYIDDANYSKTVILACSNKLLYKKSRD